MQSLEQFSQLLDQASQKCEGLNRLARSIGTTGPTLIQMRQGKRPINWKVLAKLKAVLGAGTARAYIEAAAEELAKSEREDEKKAATELLAILAALPDDGEKVERAMGIEPTS